MPPTPRPQGPKKKKTSVPVPSSKGGSPDGNNNRLYVMLGAAGLVVVVVALGYFLLGGSDGATSDAPALLEAAGCTVQTVKAMPGEHTVTTPSGTSKEWNTSPPTSGPHYEQAAIWGAYTEPLLPAQVVHNLEHGGIFIQYGKDVPQATIEELKGFYDAHQNGTLLAPSPSLGSKIALGVWTASPSAPDKGTAHLAKCTAFDKKAYAAFFDAYQFKGPERFPHGSLLPGS